MTWLDSGQQNKNDLTQTQTSPDSGQTRTGAKAKWLKSVEGISSLFLKQTQEFTAFQYSQRET